MKGLTSLPLISRLSKTVIRILGCNPGPMTLQGTNTYLVGTGARRVLIDTGDAETAKDYTELLGQVLNEERATIEHLLITHWHHDHIGGVNAVENLLKAYNKEPATVWKLPRSSGDAETTDAEISTVWQPLKDEQLIEVEGAKLSVKHTPGHTTDHACLLLLDEETLFSGDCILGEGTAVFEDLYEYMLSLNKILAIEPKMIYPGHGPVLNNPISSIQYYIKHREQREAEILQVLKENRSNGTMSEMDIVKHIYKETPESLWPVAASNVGHHLTKLLKEGRVEGSTGEWQLLEPS